MKRRIIYPSAVESSHTINSINKARQVKIPPHATIMMHTDITTLLETEYPGRDFEVMVQPNNDEYRPAIVIVLESWIDYPGIRLTYKVYLDDPTVIYYGEEYTDESELDVASDLSEKIRVIVEKYLRPFMKYEEIRSAVDDNIESIVLTQDYFYDTIDNLMDADWEDVVEVFKSLGWVHDSSAIIPSGTKLTKITEDSYYVTYSLENGCAIPILKPEMGGTPLQ